jgi:hydrogenase nickel incorporation protein HypA/HybF
VHEFSLASAISETAIRHAAGRRVTLVSLRVGRLRQVVKDTLDFYWDITTRDTVCAGSRLEIDDVPARLHCSGCDREWEIEVPAFVCGDCGPAGVTVLTGEEFQVESIEVEEESACTAPR